MIYFCGNPQLVCSNIWKPSKVSDILEYFSNKDEISLDTETEGFDPYTKGLLTIQLGDSENQFVIEYTTLSKEDIASFKNLLEKKLLILHNAKFDLRFLYHQGIYPRKVFDTYIAEAVINQGLQSRKSLQFVAQKYLKVYLDKSVRGEIHQGMTDRVIKYAADDVKYLGSIKEIQLQEIERQKRIKDLNIQNSFVRVLAYIEYCGIKLDRDLWEEKCKEDKVSLANKEDVLNKALIALKHPSYSYVQGDLFGEAKPIINWMSPKQVVPIFKFLKVDTKTKDAKGREVDSIEESVISKYKGKVPFVDLYLDYRKAEKLCSTYGENFFNHINEKSKRIHTQYSQLMDSGRTSSGGKDIDNRQEWINHQNIPRDKRTRKCFIPEKGSKFVISDYTSQETVVFTNQSLEPKMLEFFNSGESDMHSFTAKQVYPELKDLSLAEIKKSHTQKRYDAKQGGFAILYGGTPFAISNQLNVPVEEAQKFYDQYFESFKGVKEFFRTSNEQALKDGYVLIDSLTGAKCHIPYFNEFKESQALFTKEFWEDYREEKAKDSIRFKNELKPLVSKYFRKKGEIQRISVNYRIQGISALISKVAGIFFFDWILDNNLFGKVKIPVFVHDEYVAEAPEDLVLITKEMLEHCMVKAGSYWCTTIPLKAEGQIAQSWAEK